MQLGVIVSPAAGWTYAELASLATDAERAGFESFWASDHLFGGEGVPDRDCLEAWTLLAALGRDTKKIRLGCLVTAAQYRNPALLAKIVAGVDQAVCAPKPKQQPYPPIWIGGNKPRVIRVAARLADGFDISRGSQQSGPLSGADMRARIDELRVACETMKRERPLRTPHWSSVELEADRASVQALRELIAAYASAGLDRFILAFPMERAGEMVRRAGELHLKLIPGVIPRKDC